MVRTVARQSSQTPRILCVTRGDYMTLQVLRSVLDSARYEVLVVVVTGDDHRRTGMKMLSALWKASTPRYFFYECAQAAFFGLSYRIIPIPSLNVEAYARSKGVSVLKARNVNSPAVLASARKFAPDLLLCAKCPQRLHRDLLEVARCGGVNVHASLLPSIAGRAPHFWTLAHEAKAGSTAHYMTERFDDGPILVQRSIEARKEASAFELLLALSRLGGEIAQDAVALALSGVHGTPQDLTRRTYYSHPTREACRAFRASGRRLIRAADALAVLRAEYHRPRAEEIAR